MADAKKNPADPTAHLKLPRILIKALIIPSLVLAFYLAATPWANHRLQQSLVEEIEKQTDMSAAEKTERATKLGKFDFARPSVRPSPEDSPDLLKFLDKSGIATRFKRLHLGVLLCYTLLGILAVATLAILALNVGARKSPAALIRAYRTAWFIASVAAIAQVLLLTPLLTYGVFQFTVLLGDRYYPQLLFILAACGLIAIVASIKILLKKVPLTMEEPMSREVSQADAPELWASVRAAAERLKTSPPDHILVGMQLNFYVTEFTVKHDLGSVDGKTLYLSYPLMRQLSRDEIIAIIGHELGHFIGEDTRMTRDFYPMRLKVSETLYLLGTNPLVAWTSYQFLTLFAWTFGKTEQEASRARELVADQTGAAITSPAIAARALVKFHAMNEAFDRGLSATLQANDGATASFESALRHKLPSAPEFWKEVLEQSSPHPLDSHPPLRVRLTELGQEMTIEQVEAIAQEEVPSAFGEWFGARQELFAQLVQKTDEVVQVMRSKTQIATADYSTDAGRRLLEQHFPEKKWVRKPRRPWGAVTLAVLLIGGAMGFLYAFHEAGAVAFVLIWSAVIALLLRNYWIRHSNGVLTINANTIFYTGWNRALSFDDIETMRAETNNGETSVIFKLKKKAPAFWKCAIIRNSGSVSLSVMRLQDKPFEIANTIFRYLTRQVDIEPAAGKPADQTAATV